ncbi:MAG TPA: thermonuclease family protein [Blastocatellia bacterium]|nr:thermonuclease family protein [Blastocatellia bacterium]
MLQFKQRQPEADRLPDRWNIGVDRQHVVVYVALALVAGFALGFISSRMLTRRDAAGVLPPSAPLSARASETDGQSAEFHRVTRIIRADTVEVEDVGPVRLIGVETPDGKAPKEIYATHGQSALSYAEKWLLNQQVRLEYDSANAVSGNKDDKGQKLAYVYTRDGTLINGEMVKQGLAFVRPEQFRLGNDFRALEREAVQSMRGVWGPSNSASSLATSSSPATTPSSGGLGTPGLEDKSKKLTPLLPSNIGPNIPSLSGTGASEQMVFVSGGDRLYHKSGCELLDKKKHPVPLTQAKSEGYTACSRCYASTVLKAP